MIDTAENSESIVDFESMETSQLLDFINNLEKAEYPSSLLSAIRLFNTVLEANSRAWQTMNDARTHYVTVFNSQADSEQIEVANKAYTLARELMVSSSKTFLEAQNILKQELTKAICL